MRSSTTPPEASSQQRLYCARPGAIRDRALVRQASTNAAAPGPRTPTLPRWLTSKRPALCRTASCSLSTPPPGYSIGISQPPKSASLAPSATCRSCRAVRRAGGGGGGGFGTKHPRQSTPAPPPPVPPARPAEVRADVLVLAAAAPAEPGGEPALLGDVPEPVRAALSPAVLRALGVTGRADAVTPLPV